MKRMTGGLAVGAAVALVLTPSAAMAADEDQVSNDPAKVQVHEADVVPENAVVGPTLSLRETTKDVGTNATTPVPLNSTTTLSDSGSRVVQPPGGLNGEITTGFTSQVYGGANAGSVTVSGDSYARWLGTTPRDADSVSLTDKFWVANAGASVSIPPGVGWSGGTAEATYSNDFGPTWESYHNYADVKFDGVLFSYSQTSTGGFRFGSQTFYVTSDQ
jgi:hypothetical protein